MAKGFIYCITNTINEKMYVGKTTTSIEKRWKTHSQDYLKNSENIRPLYRSFKKYGIDKFTIKELEECDLNILSEREMFWIDKLNTFKLGYNATLGGDGSVLYDHNLIIETYKQGGTIVETANKIGCCTDTVANILDSNNIPRNINPINYDVMNMPKKVSQYDLENNFIQMFDSVADAARWLFNNNKIKKLQSGVRSHISNCARGKQKQAYKYIWKYDS